MSPSKLQERDVTKGTMNGPHSSSLRINNDSHAIQKPSLSNAPSSKHQKPTAKRQPVIIYTHSPKIIHAQARDFMALVQKLTGYTRSDVDDTTKSKPNEEHVQQKGPNGNFKDVVCNEDSHEPLTIQEKNDSPTPAYGIPANNNYVQAAMAADVPFFGNAISPLFREGSGFGNAISPLSFMDFKGYGDY